MKRVVLSVTGTVVGLVALLSFKSHSGVPAATTALPGAVGPGGAPSSTGPSSPPSQHHRRVHHVSHRHVHGSRSTSPTSSPTSTSGSFTGSAVQTPYGVVQVVVQVSGGHIAKVSYAQLTAYDGTSQQINSYAAPILVRQTISAQSAQITGVSGASYTSAGYRQSLQSALDKAGV